MFFHSPGWEYKDHSSYAEADMKQRAFVALCVIRSKTKSEIVGFVCDTRPLHKSYFQGLTPQGASYFAGHYRGENFYRLSEYFVFIASQPGYPPRLVPDRMAYFGSEIVSALQQVEQLLAAPNWISPPEDKLFRAVEVATSIYVSFLAIHPYANGNGHIARFIIIAILQYFGYERFFVRIHPRPHQPHDHYIALHRAGNTKPLVHYMLQHL